MERDLEAVAVVVLVKEADSCCHADLEVRLAAGTGLARAGSLAQEDQSSQEEVEDISGSHGPDRSFQVEEDQSRGHVEEKGTSQGSGVGDDSREGGRAIHSGAEGTPGEGQVWKSPAERLTNIGCSRRGFIEQRGFDMFNQKEGNGNIDMGLRIQYRSVIYIRNISFLKYAGKENSRDVPESQVSEKVSEVS